MGAIKKSFTAYLVPFSNAGDKTSPLGSLQALVEITTDSKKGHLIHCACGEKPEFKNLIELYVRFKISQPNIYEIR